MQTLTNDMGALAHSIALLHRERAAMPAVRRKAVAERASAMASWLDDAGKSRSVAARAYRAAAHATNVRRMKDVAAFLTVRRRARLDMASAQHRGLVTFMADLTAKVSTMRAGFRASHDKMAVAMQKELASWKSDRRGAEEAWHGKKPAMPAHPVNVPTMSHAAMPAAKVAATAPSPVAVPPQGARPQMTPAPQSGPGTRGPSGSSHPSGGGKS